MNFDLAWAPPFTFRHSARAKKLSLRIDSEHGLEIILPKNISKNKGMAFLQANKAWVQKHAANYQVKKSKNNFDLVSAIKIPCFNRVINIDYVTIKSAKCVTLRFIDNNRLIFFGNIKLFDECIPLMQKWIHDYAKTNLPIILNNLAKKYNFTYRKVGVRKQKTRWGSCNSYKDIQLNYKLILLPEHIVNYVILHELCHTVYMNHSADFWGLVKKIVPNYKDCVTQLKYSESSLPEWL